MKQPKQKVKTLVEALPYIRKYYGKIVVIKYGGNAMLNPRLKKSVMRDIVLLKHVGINPVIIHGGGPDIDEAMEEAGIKPRFIKGLRVTDKATMEIVEDVFDNINKEINKLIKQLGGKPISVSGRDHKLISVVQKDPKLGYVGDIKKINSEIIVSLIKENYIPIVSPIGVDNSHQIYNINADTAASSVAIALKAEKLTILTDVDGVYEKKKLLQRLSIRETYKKIKKGVIKKGMIPKVMACVYAVKNGCPKAHLINGTVKHSILLEIFTDRGVGTEIVKVSNRS